MPNITENEFRQREVEAAVMTAAALTQLARVATEFMELLKKEIEEERKALNRR
jgi:hypothetical protein